MLKNLVYKQKDGEKIGIYSACSANEFVIEAVIKKAKDNNSCVLIESTANQCDQNGGYTGMTPLMFKEFVETICDKYEFDKQKLFLGGDHLGPLTFANMDEEEAIKNAEILVKEYVMAGFTKIHIDTSMPLSSDNGVINDEIIAKRGARLVKVCEDSFKEYQKLHTDAVHPVYIVGSEVPIPGGSFDANEKINITKVDALDNTIKTFEKEFKEFGLSDAWNYVIGVVVQPGVEENDNGCVEYDRSKAKELMAKIKDYPNLIFEGHSTDYQTRYKLKELVEDGVAILKVGPGLTFALREVLFSLEKIEQELIDKEYCSRLSENLIKVMNDNPKYWQKHYHGDEKEILYKQKYSFSDRSRYYWQTDIMKKSIDVLFENLSGEIPLGLLSQYLTNQYRAIREHKIDNNVRSIVLDYIGDTIDDYLFATNQEKLI